MLAFVAMEPPLSLSAKHLRDEKEKVFEALKPLDVRHVVRGSTRDIAPSRACRRVGHRDHGRGAGRGGDWRWHGVPFFLRSGKSMGASRQTMTLGFHQPALRMFRAHRKDIPGGRVNEIVIDVADPGSIKASSWPRCRVLS